MRAFGYPPVKRPIPLAGPLYKHFIAIQDVIEDLDQDGIQDAYAIDIDGDGLINDFEIPTERIHGSASVNRSPSQLRLENQKSVVENTPAGFVIGQFEADDAIRMSEFFGVGNNFIIEQNGTLRCRSFDHELNRISVTLTATDPRVRATPQSFPSSARPTQ